MSASPPKNSRLVAAARKRPRIVLYPHAQKARLLAEVAQLCRTLDRPVSSKDLLAHFRAHPERRPLLMQGLGQVLLKAARPRGLPTPVLRKVGKVGNLAFFVPAGEAEVAVAATWKEKLDRYALGLAVERQAKLDLPARALSLLGTGHEALARHALAGFLAEWEERASDSRLTGRGPAVKTLRGQVGVAAGHARAEDFQPGLPADLIDRAGAEAVLRAEYAHRNPDEEPGWLSVNRHLAALVGAQSAQLGWDGRFSAAQVRSYAAARWPTDVTEATHAHALTLCRGYGTPWMAEGVC